MKEILKELMKYFITKGAVVTKDLQNYHFCASRFAAFIVPFYAPKEKGFLKKFKGNLYFSGSYKTIFVKHLEISSNLSIAICYLLSFLLC